MASEPLLTSKVSRSLDFTDPSSIGGGNPTRLDQTPVDPLVAPERATAAKALQFLVAAPVGVVAETLDIVSSSVGITDRDQINKFVTSLGPDSVEQYRQRNAGGFEAISTVATLFSAPSLAAKLMTSTSRVAAMTRGIPGASNLFIKEGKYKRALVNLRNITKQQAADGLVSEAATLRDPLRMAAANTARRIGAINGFKLGVGTELLLAAAYNESDFLYPEEMKATTHIALGAIGAAIGPIVNTISTNYISRKMFVLNNPRAAAARNVGGIDLTQKKAAGMAESGGITPLGPRNGSHDVDATNYFLAADANMQAARLESTNPRHKGSLMAVATQYLDEGLARVETLWRRGFAGITVGQGPLSQSPGAAAQIRHAVGMDPTTFFGTHTMRAGPKSHEELTGILAARTSQVTSLRSDASKLEAQITRAEAAVARGQPVPNIKFNKLRLTFDEAYEQLGALRVQASDMESWIPQAVRDGETIPISDLSGNFVRYSDAPENAPIKATQDLKSGKFTVDMKGSDPQGGGAFAFTIDDDLNLFVNGKQTDFNQTFANLTPYQQSGLWALGAKMVNHYAAPTTQKSLTVGANRNFFQRDIAEEILRRKPDIEVHWIDDVSREDNIALSFKEKATLWNQARDKASAVDARFPFNKTQQRETLNFPRAKAWERATDQDDSSIELFLQARRATGDLDNYTHATMTQEISKLRNALEEIDFADSSVDLLGSSFKMGHNEAGQPLQTLFLWKQNLTPLDYTQEVFALHQATTRALQFAELADPAKSRFVSSMFGKIVGSKSHQLASNMEELSDGLLQGALPGRGNRMVQGATVYQHFANRDSSVLIAAGDIRMAAEKLTRQYTTRIFNEPLEEVGGLKLSEVFGHLQSSKGETSRAFFDQWVNARRHGWTLKQAPVEIEHEGKVVFGFALDTKDQFNKQKWRQLFGESLPQEALMPSIGGNPKLPAVLDGPAYEGIQALNAVGQRLRGETNAIMRAKGFSEVGNKTWHIPPRDYTGKHVEFVVSSADGSTIMHSLVADTPAELTRMKNSPVVQQMLTEKQAVSLTLDEVREHARVWDLHWFEIADASIPTVQLGKATKGSSASPLVEAGNIEGFITSINNQINRLGRDVTKVVFASEIDYAKAQSRSIRAPKSARDSTGTRSKNVFDRYVDTMLGNRILSHDTRLGAGYIWAEDSANVLLRALHEKTQGLGIRKHIAGKVAETLGRQTADERLFNRLKGDMGEHLPFETAVEFAANRFNIKPPPELQGLTAEINRITSALVLRWGEIAHPILNVTGVVNTMPAVLAHFRRIPGESEAAYLQRTQTWGHTVPTEGGSLSYPDSAKIMMRGMMHSWRGGKRGGHDYKIAKEMGLLDQQVAEIHMTMGQPRNVNDTWHNFQRNADKWVGGLSDKSEEFSRAWSHMSGVHVARDIMKMTDDVDVHNFAHNFANQVIGDYRSGNRPQMFQGAVGLPLGLFQTYMWNYFQRIFRYVETGNKRALTTQAAMQASLYGASTLPGWGQYTALLAHGQGDGTLDPVRSLQERLGPGADAVLHGTLSSLPKLFGVDGVNLYTRADTTPRLAVMNPSQIPALNVARTTLQAIGRGVDMFREGHPGVTAQEMLEIMGTFSVNRPFRGWMEMAAGYSVDRQGNVISENTLDTLSVIARIAGFRPMQEGKEIDAYYRQRQIQSIELSKRERLRLGTRAAARSGDLSQATGALKEYLSIGGNPAQAGTWIRDTIMGARSSRMQNQLLEALKGSPDMDAVSRIMQAGTRLE